MDATADRPPSSDTAHTGASDEHLVQRYAAGEVDAFDALYARHELPVWRYVLRIVRSPALADTLLGEIWFSVLRQIAQMHRASEGAAPADDADASSSGGPGGVGWRFKPWLFGLAHGCVIEHIRKSKKLIDPQSEHVRPAPAASERNAGRLSSAKPPDRSARAIKEAAAFRQLRSLREAKALLAAVEHLPFAQRYAFLMHAEGGLRLDHIARATAVSFETAINRLRSAREALRLSLSDQT